MSIFVVFLVALMLITGAVNTLTKKFQNQSVAPGLNNEPHLFQHPWFQTFVMFVGETACLIPLLIQRRQARLHKAKGLPLEKGMVDPDQPLYSPIFILPTMCDLVGSTLAGIGLLWTPASVWQMLRGSIIIFGGILSVIFLKKRLTAMNWVGMAVVFAGLAAVGTSSLIGGGDSTDGKLVIGIVFILAGQLASAVQMVIEETFLKKREYPALHVVGMEGLHGLLIMSFIVMPILYFIPGEDAGSYENYVDAFVQIGNNVPLLMFNLVYLVSIAFYNFSGLSVAKFLSTVHRTLIDACRTILVWLAAIILFYAGLPAYGEGWKQFSWLQLLGFGLLLIGTGIYNGIFQMIREKCSKKKKSQPEEEAERLLSQADDEKSES